MVDDSRRSPVGGLGFAACDRPVNLSEVIVARDICEDTAQGEIPTFR